MARVYAPLLCSIWNDDRFIALPSQAQRVYLLAFSQANTSYAGVVPYTEKRWAKRAPDTTPGSIAEAVNHLIDGSFVLLDDDTEELWVRSFIKHNKINEQKQLHRALAAACRSILSPTIRGAVHGQLCDEVKDLLSRGADPWPGGSETPAGEPLYDLDLDPDLDLNQDHSSSSTSAPNKEPSTAEEDFASACSLLAQRALDAQPAGSVRVPDRWLQKATEERMERHRHRRAGLSWSSVSELAELLEPPTSTPLDEAQKAQRAAMLDCSEPMPWTADDGSTPEERRAKVEARRAERRSA